MKITSIPQIYRNLNRWREILQVLSKYGLANWISRLDIEFAKGLFKAPAGEALARQRPETRIRLALAELGPTFIKIGQILSTRGDLIGRELAAELQQLQDRAPADSGKEVRGLIEAEFGESVDDLFSQFDNEPLASASIGQVHGAVLMSGERVVVKVQHVRIEQAVRVDLDILMGLAQLAELIPELESYNPRAVAAELQRTIRRELDFGREERNMQQFAHDFADDDSVRIPQTFPELCTHRVLTMERLDGVKLCDAEHVATGGFDTAELARRGANLYMKMMFTHGFYHADPHPGNILLMPGNVIGLVDFGMVGRIDEPLREDIEDMLLALANRDPAHLTAIIMRLGHVPPGTDEATLCLDVADFVSHYAHQRLDQFDLSGALTELTAMIRRYHIVLPARAALLIKVIVMLEGTSRLLSPQFSLMEVMVPYQRKMVLRRLSPGRRLRKLRRIYTEFERLVEMLPRGMMEILQQVQSGKFDVHLDHRGLEPSVNRLVLGMLASALFLGSSLLLSRDVPPLIYLPPLFDQLSLLGLSGCLTSLALGLRLLRAINKSGHLDRRK